MTLDVWYLQMVPSYLLSNQTTRNPRESVRDRGLLMDRQQRMDRLLLRLSCVMRTADLPSIVSIILLKEAK